MVYASIAHEQPYLDQYFDEFSKIARRIPEIIEQEIILLTVWKAQCAIVVLND